MIQERNDQGVLLCFPAIIDKYKVISTINRGSFSVVVLVENMKTGMKYACKVISRQILEERETIIHFEQEIRLHQTLKHENICELVEILFQQDYIFMILEYCSKGELFEFVCKNPRLNYSVIRKMFSQLVAAIQYLHAKDIAHRDLKLENIYLDDNLNVKLGDFGFSHKSTKDSLLMTSCGSCYYVAPEIIRGEMYDGKKADIWSVGVILFVISTGGLPWAEKNQVRLYEKIEHAEYVIPSFVPHDIQEIIKMCIVVDPKERPDIETLAQTPFVAECANARIPIDAPCDQYTASSFISLKRRPIIVRPNGSARNSIDFKGQNIASMIPFKRKKRYSFCCDTCHSAAPAPVTRN